MDEQLLEELFASIGPVRVKRMFGGQGVYSGDRIVAAVLSGELYLKGDAEAAPRFLEAGCRQWTYQRPGRALTHMPYFLAPDAFFEDPDAARFWAATALQAAERANAAKKHKAGRGPAVPD